MNRRTLLGSFLSAPFIATAAVEPEPQPVAYAGLSPKGEVSHGGKTYVWMVAWGKPGVVRLSFDRS